MVGRFRAGPQSGSRVSRDNQRTHQKRYFARGCRPSSVTDRVPSESPPLKEKSLYSTGSHWFQSAYCFFLPSFLLRSLYSLPSYLLRSHHRLMMAGFLCAKHFSPFDGHRARMRGNLRCLIDTHFPEGKKGKRTTKIGRG